ncbi:MAG: hypothetical protein L6Q37_11115 [Bdellovibrionaceae bacterium]|nr:hypothetical protein [Pseudobdellovibrionaceae bacterium]NUM57778.1 hypothetical protein [Pseudobdellovibrionaceae bacterium]
MNHLKFFGTKNELIEIIFTEDLRLFKNNSQNQNIDIEVQVKSGAWTSSRFPQYLEAGCLISFLKDLRSLLKFSLYGASLQDDTEMLFIRIALSKNRNGIWIYGHIRELDHKNELNFSFDSTPELLASLLDQIEAMQLDV